MNLTFIFSILFIYLFEREHRQGGGAEGEREAEPLLSRVCSVLTLGTLGSWLEPKAGA